MKRDRTAELTAWYGSDASLGVRIETNSGRARLPDGGYASNCYDCASYIRSREPGAAVFGFFSRDNPTWAGAQLVDGHDFVIVQGRYIVDPWIVETEHLSDRSVFDIERIEDAAEITRLYGRSDRWVLVERPTRRCAP
jgi:hypothetical protein